VTVSASSRECCGISMTKRNTALFGSRVYVGMSFCTLRPRAHARGRALRTAKIHFQPKNPDLAFLSSPETPPEMLRFVTFNRIVFNM
ncbi:MAG: hypothetical protein ACYTEK_25910, partial [Planctomycetota bacterium]